MSADFVKSANLPLACRTILVGEKYYFIANNLRNRGYNAALIPNNPNVDARLSGHADLSVFHMGGERLLLAPYLRDTELADGLMKLGAELQYMKAEQKSLYPDDAGLNACVIGKRFFVNSDSCCEEINNYFTRAGIESVNVRQGYTRCSVCIVNENAVITSDAGIAERAKLAGVDALLISPGYIDLEGFAYGFIGGSSFKLSRTELAFTGHIDQHPDRERILRFLDKHGVTPIYLTDGPIFDIGSAVPLTEG